MKSAEWKRAARPLADALPAFRAMRRGFVREHEWVAECIYADQSGFSKSVYLEAFVMPLFIPADSIYFNYGFRIGSGTRTWSTIDDKAVAAVLSALPQLHKLASVSALIAHASEWKVNPYHLELRLRGSLIQRDERLFTEGNELLRGWKIEVAWERDIIDRCHELVEFVDQAGMEAGVLQLHQRRDSVLAVLQ